MRKIFAVIIAAALCLSLCACDTVKNLLPGENPESANSKGKAEPVQSAKQEETENKVGLSIDKTAYEKEERIAVSLDFAKLNQEEAVAVIIDSSAAHGNETAAHEEDSREEYRWLADFSEIPFYMWAPDRDGLFDVRIYENGEGGAELASVTFAVGNAVLPKEKPQQTEDSLWFSEETLAEMKIPGFTQPEGFAVLTAEELPDYAQNDPYYRAIKGAAEMSEYFPLIEKAFGLLRESYGEVYTWNYYPDELPSYKWESEMNYGGDPFYVWEGETIRSVSFTFSGSWEGIEGEVLQIRLNPDSEDPRDDYDWQ